ncbi:ABC transporter permease [Parasedimentitalea psychrophila]|uniref:ABC transporter permease n=1 Tax=Parasedimentitalea psychrophila TaxID=2997337 RepID=A0A9Y2L5R2_9RHOB|nr:ABC transporter permease [Parasedimentitalea psychrophila]WIY27424.1 ABC transporter permease [Parasedimentitalea psychrophila]
MNIGTRILSNIGRYLPVYAVAYLIFLYLPVLLLPVFSFNDSQILSFPLSGFTTKWYAQLSEQSALLKALGNSLFVALISAALATSLGTLASRAVVKYKYPFKNLSYGIVMAPLVMPEIIIAISLLILFLGIGVDPSLYTVILGHTLLTIPFCVSIMTSAFGQFDDSLEEAAIDLGESTWGALRRVTIPVVSPGIISSMLVSFTVSFDEFILAFFLSGNRPTLPVYIWSQVRFPAKLPIVLALGSVLIVVSLLFLALAEYFRRRSVRLQTKT